MASSTSMRLKPRSPRTRFMVGHPRSLRRSTPRDGCRQRSPSRCWRDAGVRICEGALGAEPVRSMRRISFAVSVDPVIADCVPGLTRGRAPGSPHVSLTVPSPGAVAVGSLGRIRRLVVVRNGQMCPERYRTCALLVTRSGKTCRCDRDDVVVELRRCARRVLFAAARRRAVRRQGGADQPDLRRRGRRRRRGKCDSRRRRAPCLDSTRARRRCAPLRPATNPVGGRGAKRLSTTVRGTGRARLRRTGRTPAR